MELRIEPTPQTATAALVDRVRIQDAPRRIPRVEKPGDTGLREMGEEQKPEERRAPAEEIDREALRVSAENAQAMLEELNIRLDFKVSEETGDLIVRVLHRETEEVIREIPPEDVRKLNQKLVELRGVLFDEKA